MIMTSALSVATSVWGTRVRAHRAEVHEAWEGDDPKVPGVDYVTAIELGEEPALGTWWGKAASNRANQKPIG